MDESKPLLRSVKIDDSDLELLDKKLEEEGILEDDDDDESDSDEEDEHIPDWTKRQGSYTTIKYSIVYLVHCTIIMWC